MELIIIEVKAIDNECVKKKQKTNQERVVTTARLGSPLGVAGRPAREPHRTSMGKGTLAWEEHRSIRAEDRTTRCCCIGF